MAFLAGMTAPEGVNPSSLDASLVTAVDRVQPGVVPAGEADVDATPGSVLESTGGQLQSASVPPAVAPVEATPGSTALESARSGRLPLVGSTPELPGSFPGMFTPGPTLSSWVQTPLLLGATSTRATAATGSTSAPEDTTPGTGQASPPLASYVTGNSKTRNRSSRRRGHRSRHSSTSRSRSVSSEEDYDATHGPTRPSLEDFDFLAHQVGDASLNKVTY